MPTGCRTCCPWNILPGAKHWKRKSLSPSSVCSITDIYPNDEPRTFPAELCRLRTGQGGSIALFSVYPKETNPIFLPLKKTPEFQQRCAFAINPRTYKSSLVLLEKFYSLWNAFLLLPKCVFASHCSAFAPRVAATFSSYTACKEAGKLWLLPVCHERTESIPW